HDVLEHARRRFVGVERAGDGGDRPRPDLMPARDQVGELAHHALAHHDLALLALEGDDVAAQEDPAVEMGLERTEHGILAAGKLGCDLVRELDLPPHRRSAALTIPDTRLPSARPSTAAIAVRIAAPMSFVLSAPLSRTACATISASSASESSAGRYEPISSPSASSAPASSSRPPARNCSAASSRRLRSRRSTASSSSLPSFAAFCSSDRTSLSAPTFSFSPARIAPVRSVLICSAIAIFS